MSDPGRCLQNDQGRIWEKVMADGHPCGTLWPGASEVLVSLLQSLDGGFGGKAGRRLSRALSCWLLTCCVPVCVQDVSAGHWVWQQVGVVTGVHTSTRASTCACTHLVPGPQALQSMQGHFLFLFSAFLLGEANFPSEHPTAHIYGVSAVCKT